MKIQRTEDNTNIKASYVYIVKFALAIRMWPHCQFFFFMFHILVAFVIKSLMEMTIFACKRDFEKQNMYFVFKCFFLIPTTKIVYILIKKKRSKEWYEHLLLFIMFHFGEHRSSTMYRSRNFLDDLSFTHFYQNKECQLLTMKQCNDINRDISINWQFFWVNCILFSCSSSHIDIQSILIY